MRVTTTPKAYSPRRLPITPFVQASTGAGSKTRQLRHIQPPEGLGNLGRILENSIAILRQEAPDRRVMVRGIRQLRAEVAYRAAKKKGFRSYLISILFIGPGLIGLSFWYMPKIITLIFGVVFSAVLAIKGYRDYRADLRFRAGKERDLGFQHIINYFDPELRSKLNEVIRRSGPLFKSMAWLSKNPLSRVAPIPNDRVQTMAREQLQIYKRWVRFIGSALGLVVYVRPEPIPKPSDAVAHLLPLEIQKRQAAIAILDALLEKLPA